MARPKFTLEKVRCSRNLRTSCCGATLVDIALALPFLLVIVFGMIWLGTSIHARSSLDAMLTRSLRLAATRGVKERLNDIEIISVIQDYHDTGALDDRLRKMLTANDNVPWNDAKTEYNTQIQKTFPSCSLRTLPPEYVYFYVYACESMRTSVGPSVKCGCDPHSANGSGCLTCAPLDPDTLTVSPSAKYDCGAVGYDDVPRRRMGFQCSYRPANAFVTPVTMLVNLLSGSSGSGILVFSREQFYDIPSL